MGNASQHGLSLQRGRGELDEEFFWRVLGTASCGPTGSEGDLDAARERAGLRWPLVQAHFVHLASQVGGAHDWGILGLDVEAAVRARVVLQSLHQPDLHPRHPWPPDSSWGSARAPWDLLLIGEILAERLGVPLHPIHYNAYPPETWEAGFRPLMGVGTRGPLEFMVDQRWRRAYLEALDATVEYWARTGPHLEPGDELWEAVGNDGLESFCRSRGASVLGGAPAVAAQFRAAVIEVHGYGSSDLTARVRWIASLRTVLAGHLVMLASRSLADLRPWPQDEVLSWVREFLTPHG